MENDSNWYILHLFLGEFRYDLAKVEAVSNIRDAGLMTLRKLVHCYTCVRLIGRGGNGQQRAVQVAEEETIEQNSSARDDS